MRKLTPQEEVKGLAILKGMVHERFDPLWMGGPLERSTAYMLLADEMGMRLMDCHVKQMGLLECLRALFAIERLREKTMPATDEECWVWVDHQHMRPMLASEVVAYWTTMPRPVTRAVAEAKVVEAIRNGVLVRADPFLR